MAILEVAQLEKSFGGTKVLRDISFSLEEGQALSIIKTRHGIAPASGFSYAVISLLSETLTRLKSENRIIQPT